MQFAYTIVYVQSVAATLAFFEQAFGLERSFLHPSGGYGELATGSTALAFAAHDVARENVGARYVAVDASAPPPGIEIGFVVADVEAACERALAAGAVLVKPAATKPWGQTVAYLRSPDGLLIELCTKMG